MKTRRPILFLGPRKKRFGGVERRFARIFQHMRTKGYPAFYFSTSDGINGLAESGTDLNNDPNVQVYRKKQNNEGLSFWANGIAISDFLFKVIRENDIKHVHFLGMPCLKQLVVMILMPLDATFSHTVMTYDIPNNRQMNMIYRLFVRYMLRKSLFIDCLSSTIREKVQSYFSEDRTHPPLEVSPCSFTDYSHAFSAENKDIDFCMIGRYLEMKGYRLALEALELLDKHPYTRPLNVHFCGYGPLEHELVLKKESFKNIDLHVYYVKRPTEVLARTKVFLSLQDENYPSQSLLEAMACQCAIIATNCGETWRLVDGNVGLRIPPKASELNTAMLSLLNDRSRRKKMGQKAEQFVREFHTIDRFSDYFELLLEKYT